MDKNIVKALEIAQKVAEKSGTAYFVGGFVRDKILGIETKDIDIEVHGVSDETLSGILSSLGEKIETGKSFGVYGLRGYTIDIAMPRSEENTGAGHRDFKTVSDPFIGEKKAAERRDFTINALMQNVLTGEVLDFFGGHKDLGAGVVRHISDFSFADDPLRVLRAAQFAARLGFSVAPETVKKCSGMSLSALSKERVAGEVYKALLKAEKPSVFFSVLREMNQLDGWFPEVKNLIGVEQNPKYHAEGDVWKHTMMVLDMAAKYRGEVRNPKGFMLAALVHDFGKAKCTVIKDGKIHSYGHESEGVFAAKRFLERITGDKKLIHYVLNMTQNHMMPNVLAAEKAGVKSTNKMFDKSCEPLDLIYLAAADKEGQICETNQGANTGFLLERLEEYYKTMEKPFVSGADLIGAGLIPDERFSDILAYAHKLRLAGVGREDALKQTLAYARKTGIKRMTKEGEENDF